MPNNNFVPVAAAAGANVTTDVNWNGSSFQVSGVQKGIVPSAGMNKAWRQGTMGSSALGQIIVDHGLIDAIDDGSVPNFKANLRMAITAMLAGTAFAVDKSSTPNLITIILDPVPPDLSIFRGIYVRAANTNTGPVTLGLNALGVRPVVKKNGLPLSAGDIVAGQFTHLVYDLTLGQWAVAGQLLSDTVATVLANGGRTVLNNNLNLYVNAATGSNNPNSGLTFASPFATIQYAYDFLRRGYDLNGYTVTINVAAGTYPAIIGTSPVVGATGPSSVQIIGNITSPTACVINGVGQTTVAAVTAGVYFTIQGFRLTGNGALLLGAANGGIIQYGNIDFASTGGSHIGANAAGQVTCIGNYSISAGALAHVATLTAGQANISGVTVTLNGTPNFSASFANASTLGIIASSGCTFVGGAVGARYSANSNSVIGTNGSGATYFPGSAGGAVATGGLYL